MATKPKKSMKFHFKAIISDKRGMVLSVGENNYNKTHPFMARLSAKCNEDKKIFLHAEIAAILKCRHLDKAHLIHVYQINNDGSIKLVKPCRICQSAIDAIKGLKVAQ